MVHFGPFWPDEVHLGPQPVLWPFLIFGTFRTFLKSFFELLGPGPRLGCCGPGKLPNKGKSPKVVTNRGGCKRSF